MISHMCISSGHTRTQEIRTLHHYHHRHNHYHHGYILTYKLWFPRKEKGQKQISEADVSLSSGSSALDSLTSCAQELWCLETNLTPEIWGPLQNHTKEQYHVFPCLRVSEKRNKHVRPSLWNLLSVLKWLISAPTLSLLNVLTRGEVHVVLSKETKEVQTVLVIKEISP